MTLVVLDTNVLVYLHRADAAEHDRAVATVRRLHAGGASLSIVPFVAMEFVRVVTHPRIMPVPSPTPVALDFVDGLLTSDAVRWYGSAQSWTDLRVVLDLHDTSGNDVYDAAVLAAALAAGATAVLTNDASFPAHTALDVLPLDGASR